MIHEFVCNRRNAMCTRLNESRFTPGKEYIDAYGKACFDYGLSDIQDMMSYYRNYINDNKNILDVSPQDLAEMYAIHKGIGVMYKMDDKYFEKYMDKALKMGTPDDFVMSYWEQQTKDHKTTNTPAEEMAKGAFKAQQNSHGGLALDKLEQIRRDSANNHTSPESIQWNTIRIDSVPTEDQADELQARFRNGFYYTSKYEKGGRSVGFDYWMQGNTEQLGEKGEPKGENVRIIFGSSAAKYAFIKLVWPEYMEAGDHMKSLESKAKGPGSSEAVRKDKDGNKLKTWKNGKLTGYRSDITGEWVDILEDDKKNKSNSKNKNEDSIASFLKPVLEDGNQQQVFQTADGQKLNKCFDFEDDLVNDKCKQNKCQFDTSNVYQGDFPAWALDYIVNNELGSVSRIEKQQIEDWIETMEQNGFNTGLIQFGDDEYFSSNPEFGLPCDCVSCKLVYDVNKTHS